MMQLINELGIKDAVSVLALVRKLTAELIDQLMDAVLEDDIGYSKYDYRNKKTDNSRNSTCKKAVSSSHFDIELEVLLDRNG
jgi:transposase-like protein